MTIQKNDVVTIHRETRHNTEKPVITRKVREINNGYVICDDNISYHMSRIIYVNDKPYQYVLQYYKKVHNDNLELLYRTIPIQFNDGLKGYALQYLSHFNIWQGTNEDDRDKFIKDKLTPITEHEFINLYKNWVS